MPWVRWLQTSQASTVLGGDIGAYINSTERVLLDEVEGWTRAARSPIQEGSEPGTSGGPEES
jgi:hypothetical protein